MLYVLPGDAAPPGRSPDGPTTTDDYFGLASDDVNLKLRGSGGRLISGFYGGVVGGMGGVCELRGLCGGAAFWLLRHAVQAAFIYSGVMVGLEGGSVGRCCFAWRARVRSVVARSARA